MPSRVPSPRRPLLRGTAFAVVDNQNYSYSVTIEGDASSSGGDIQLYGIHVQYFVSDALP